VRYIVEKEGEIDFLVGGKAIEVKYWDSVEADQINCLSSYKGRHVNDKYVITRRANPDIGHVKSIPMWRFLDDQEDR